MHILMNAENILLKALTDLALLKSTQSSIEKEKHATAEVLAHLQELDARKLYLKLGYGSLFELLTVKFQYSAGQAQRRIDAARLTAELPELLRAVKKGELQLHQLSQAQAHFRAEKKVLGLRRKPEERLELVKNLSGLSSRETERRLAALSPELSEKVEKQGLLLSKAGHVELTWVLGEKEQALFEEARGLLACPQKFSPTVGDVFTAALQSFISEKRKKKGLGLEAIAGTLARSNGGRSANLNGEPKTRAKAEPSTHVKLKEINISSAGNGGPHQQSSPLITPRNSSTPSTLPARATRYIPVATKKAVLERSGGMCEYRSEIPQGASTQQRGSVQHNGTAVQHNSTAPSKSTAQKRCGSQHSLEFHHTHPFAMGGTSSAGNIQLFCAAHNRAQGKWDFSSTD
jgi:hypothetical protein